ncbi:RNA dependent RNA polymerase-domain-containing protein [Armillaria novae-zelandiae]|uniref:RNA-dependent RNA polymerase n=1 Tax=Armillaria novae-zelandiae TaxID=153914 RepID=A0AA39PBQ1_9AGAR|nr:RNA dependent RNA polymerase-domain-containing protein [Armillaria novae-zelandiae]
MKKYPDFEYDADKDQLEGEDVPMLDGENAPPEVLPDVEDEPTSQSSQWEGDEFYKDAIKNYKECDGLSTINVGTLTNTQQVVEDHTENGKRKSSDTIDLSSSGTLVDGQKPVKLRRVDDDAQDDQPWIVAHHSSLENEFNQLNISIGVRMELARLKTSSELTEEQMWQRKDRLQQLRGSNQDAAPNTRAMFLPGISRPGRSLILRLNVFPRTSIPVWATVNNGHGWYGGKITFRAQYSRDSEKILIERPTLDMSNSLKRRFGSWCFLRVKIEDQCGPAIVNFFKRPIVIWNARTMLPWYGSTKLSLRERIERPLHGLKSFGVGYSLFDFVNLLNPLEENRNQFLGKWASRIALYLSVSVPGPRFREEDIHEQDDHFSAEKSNMTDGCGISNLPLHLKFTRQNNRMPTAVQFRLRGAKGMLLLLRNEEWLDKPGSSGPPSTEERPEVWFRRPSQIKINYPATKSLDPLHLTMAILHFSSIQSPARLSAEVIINLEHNGVPAAVFEQLGRNCIQQVVQDFATCSTPDAYRLWASVEDVEGIYSARRMRVTENRKRPLRRKKDDEDDHDAGAWFPDPHSGCPTSLGETAMELLDSGFLPDKCNYLKQRLWRVAKTKMYAVSSQFNFELEQSCSGLVVIDPYGVLEENEIQVKSSRHSFKTDDGFETDTVLGEVVVTAVTHPKLADMTDVIVCSIKGGTALLQYLAGGDYDGDRILVIWARAIVDTFRNAHEDYMKPPPGFEDLFERDTKTVDEFCREMAFASSHAKAKELQTRLLAPLSCPSAVGRISSLHDNCVYSKGYSHPDTLCAGQARMQNRFARIMDSAKTGYRLKSDSRLRGMSQKTQAPQWRTVQKNAKLSNSENVAGNKGNLPPCKRIVDESHIVGKYTMRDIVVAMQENVADWAKVLASHVAPPWNDAISSGKYQGDLTIIRKHVDNIHTQWLSVRKNKLEFWKLFPQFNTISPINVNSLFFVLPVPISKTALTATVLLFNLLPPSSPTVAFEKGMKTLEHLARKDQARYVPDMDLAKTWQSMTSGKELWKDLDIIKKHVDDVYAQWHSTPSPPYDKIRQRRLACSKAFNSSPTLVELRLLKDEATISRLRASYAYVTYQGTDKEHCFAFEMAFRELCHMKANAGTGQAKTMTRGFYDRMKLKVLT